jgi:hypothetical protein
MGTHIILLAASSLLAKADGKRTVSTMADWPSHKQAHRLEAEVAQAFARSVEVVSPPPTALTAEVVVVVVSAYVPPPADKHPLFQVGGPSGLIRGCAYCCPLAKERNPADTCRSSRTSQADPRIMVKSAQKSTL